MADNVDGEDLARQFAAGIRAGGAKQKLVFDTWEKHLASKFTEGTEGTTLMLTLRDLTEKEGGKEAVKEFDDRFTGKALLNMYVDTKEKEVDTLKRQQAQRRAAPPKKGFWARLFGG
jgi:hypothetical protein